MNVKVFGYNLTQDNVNLIRRMVGTFTKPDFPVDIKDIRCNKVETSNSDIVVIYGVQAQRKLKDYPFKYKIEFPDPERLDTISGSKEDIEQAKQKIIKFRKLLDSDDIGLLDSITEAEEEFSPESLKLTTEDLPANLTASDVKKLEAHCSQKNIEAWVATTTNGRKIRITLEPQESSADVNMTFAELHAVIGLTEILRVKELEIVYKPSLTIK